MFNKLLPLILFFSISIHRAEAQSGTISVGPLLTCDLTTFSCPGTSGCCTIAGCCGSGCCANGYTCINEGTSDEACCSAFDSTKCGTVTPSSGSGSGSSSGSGSGSGSSSQDKTCTRIHNCPRDPENGLAWTCVLGRTCGFSYGDCYPCPCLGGICGSSGGSSGSGSSGSDSGSSSSTSSESDSSSSSSPSSSSSSSSPTSSSTPTSSSRSSSSSSSATPSSGSASSSGCISREFGPIKGWLSVVTIGTVLVVAF